MGSDPRFAVARALDMYTQRWPGSSWFVVSRPTPSEAQLRLMNGTACGKSLMVKGKSATTGHLAGLVPFLQLQNDSHKDKVKSLPGDML